MNQPDKTEKTIMFICGVGVGLLTGLSLIWVFQPTLSVGVIIVLISILVFGCIAMMLGDRFWGILKYWWPW